MKNLNISKIYSILGKTLCTTAGAIVGFIYGGPLLAVLGIFVGFITGHMLEKSILKPTVE